MSNIKFYTNRQVALQLAVEWASKQAYQVDALKKADELYEWLQSAPCRDEDFETRLNRL